MQQDFQKRVVDERTELNTKILALFSFIDGDIFNALDGDEQWNLRTQYNIMLEYSNILKRRIDSFKGE